MSRRQARPDRFRLAFVPRFRRPESRLIFQRIGDGKRPKDRRQAGPWAGAGGFAGADESRRHAGHWRRPRFIQAQVDSPGCVDHHHGDTSPGRFVLCSPRRDRFMRSRLLLACVTVLASWSTLALAIEVQNVVVYREPGRFGGWPANHGMWNWGNELLVGFSAGYYKDNGPDAARHRSRPARGTPAGSQPRRRPDLEDRKPGRARGAHPARQRTARHRVAARRRSALDRLPRRHRLHASRFRHDAADER